jgi:hypothetical protein
MAKYLLNTTMSTYLFRGGNIEIEPKKVKAVTDTDFKTGIFEAAILSGALLAFDREEDVTLVTGTIPSAAKVEVINGAVEPGASKEELIAFIAAQKKKAEETAAKYKVEAEVIESQTPVESVEVVNQAPADETVETTETPVVAAKTGRSRKTTPVIQD